MTPYLVILVGFASLLGAMLVLEMAARAGRQPLRPAARSRIGRWLVFGVWLWVGFHFLAR